MAYQTVNEQLFDASQFISGAQSVPSIREAFTEVGRGAAYFERAEALFEQANRLSDEQLASRNGQRKATRRLNQLRGAVHASYMRHVKLARLVLEGNVAARESLVLDGRRAHALEVWLGQAGAFYENALGEEAYQQALAGVGITQEKLEEGRRRVAAVHEAREAQRRARGRSKAATLHRDEALAELRSWMSENRRLIRLLMGEDQRLEALGIVVPSQ